MLLFCLVRLSHQAVNELVNESMTSNLVLQIHHLSPGFLKFSTILPSLACRGAAIFGLNSHDFLFSLTCR